MSYELSQEGNFRGQIVEYGVNEADSGAVSIALNVAVEEIFHEGEWHDWREHGFTVRGDVWAIKKDGTLNKKQVEALMTHAGWDGSFTSVVQGTWQPTPIGFAVERDEYKNEVRFRLTWVNAYDATPGGGGNVDATKAKTLDTKLGSQMRALAGNKARNEAPAAAKGNPAKPAPSATAKSSPDPVSETPPADDIPF